MRTTGIILIVIGILMLIFRGISFTKEKKVAEIGPVEINKKENRSIGWPVYAGSITVAAGFVILLISRKK